MSLRPDARKLLKEQVSVRLLLRGLITTLMLAATSVQASDQRLKSIRDLRSVFSSPWKKRFFTLLGQPRSLDDIEHGMIRAKGAYDDPRIHMAINCASIALRDDWSLNDAQDR
jgi:hypothetical protein